MGTHGPWVEWFLLGSEFHQVYGELILPLCYIQLFLVYVCVIQMCPFDLLGCVNQCNTESFWTGYSYCTLIDLRWCSAALSVSHCFS